MTRARLEQWALYQPVHPLSLPPATRADAVWVAVAMLGGALVLAGLLR
jgi:hypothetical protein